MKRVLYGTTALVAAGLLVTSVSYAGDEEMMEEEMMAAPISVGVGGYYRVAAGGVSAEEPNMRGHFIQQNIEINLTGETTLDNGINAGVNIWLSGNDGRFFGSGGNPRGINISETRVYFSGAFGTLTAGSFENAAQLGHVWAPGGNSNFGIDSPFFNETKRVWWGSGIGSVEDALKISYSSPSFNGISLSASYSPEASKDSYAARETDEDEISEVTSLSLAFSQEVMGGSVNAGVGIENGTYENCSMNCEVSSMRGGLTLSIDQVSVGGNVFEVDDDQGTITKSESSFGIGWSQGPLGVGLQYGSGDSFDVMAFNAAYALGPGIELNSQIASGSAGGSDFSEFMLGTAIFF